MEKPPFVFGHLAEKNEFTDREEDLKHILTNFQSGINTILISPRRWGKSSLINKAVEVIAAKTKKIRVCNIDLFNMRSEEQFYQLYAQEVIKASSSKWEEAQQLTTTFLSRFIPKISFSASPESEIEIGLNWREVRKDPAEILNLPEKIAKSKNIRMVICIDEFQHVSEFDAPVAFQKKLRAVWQRHQNTSYCLYGSKRHMMLDVFTHPSMPFYKFGDIVFLNKIDEKHWTDFIVKRFKETGKRISPPDALLIAQLVECHSYYVQQLAQLTWLRSGKVCNTAIVNEAHESLTMQLSLLFQGITDSLTNSQVNFLKVIIDEVEKVSSKATLRDYDIGTSANVQRIKANLLRRELIDVQKNKIELLDPVYKHWLKKYYFTMSQDN